MLYLQAGVHFHEVELHGFGLVVAALFDDEFHRARTHIVDGTGGSHGCCTHLRAQRFRHAGCGRFFQHLLVAALHRAIALKQIHAVALAVAKHLDFNMARALHVFFN